jgi:hypothetical protein
MNHKPTAKHSMPLAARLALCVGIGTALTVSTGAAVGIAVAAGLYLALTLPSRC